jgi:hypothetical protein
VSKHFENKARRSWWLVHVEAWRRSGLSQQRYCRENWLTKRTFGRWLKVLVDAESLRLQRHFEREERRQRKPRRLSTDKRNRAVQAFWAMHVEAISLVRPDCSRLCQGAPSVCTQPASVARSPGCRRGLGRLAGTTSPERTPADKH